jgi:uncharacterized membrane protein (Fun14 family)
VMASETVGMNFLIAFGCSSLAGFLSGYALKKALKIIAFVVGLFFAALAYLQYSKGISVN